MARVVWLVLGCVLLAGCTDATDSDRTPEDEADPSTTSGAPTATEVPIALPGCSVVEAFATADPALARQHIPEGFDPVVEDGRTPVVLGGLMCGGDSDTKRAFLALMVTPTHDVLLAEGDTNYFWEPEHLVTDASEYARTLRAIGGNFTPLTSFAMEMSTTSASFRAGSGEQVHEGSVAGAAPPGPLSQTFGHFREYSQADNGYAYLEATFGNTGDSFAGMAIGTVTTAPDTPARALLGESITTPVLFGGEIPYDDARLGFVPWPPA